MIFQTPTKPFHGQSIRPTFLVAMTPEQTRKRKLPNVGDQAPNASRRDAKRVKTSSARTILAQSSDKALNQNGDLDVASFVKAREYEIKALEASMSTSKGTLTTRAFQQVPRDLRRRTASHNVKKVPKRLRTRAAKEMKDDNTPTVTARTRKPTPHMRLRLEKAKKIQGIGARAKAKKAALKEQRAKDGENLHSTGTIHNFPSHNKNTLTKPPVPPSKFKKRQICKSWLPTHLFHAKRAHMTPPKEPLWRFAIPMTPTEKSYRATHRASSMRGCIAWDMSYVSTIGIEGVEPSLLGLLRSLGVPEDQLVSKQGSKWRNGTRYWTGWMRERDATDVWIAKVQVIWCANKEQQQAPDQDQAIVLEESISRLWTMDNLLNRDWPKISEMI
ncbi:MAG: hypothetical protein Q9187_008917 [Circinaria calcarea]